MNQREDAHDSVYLTVRSHSRRAARQLSEGKGPEGPTAVVREDCLGHLGCRPIPVTQENTRNRYSRYKRMIREELVRWRQRFIFRISGKHSQEDEEGTRCRGSFESD